MNLKYLKIFLVFSLILLNHNISLITKVHADEVIDKGFGFLRSKQEPTGRIATGFSAPSQWSAIAFAANGVDISTVKNSQNSLKDFLLSDIPAEPSAATDWEVKILAIVATGNNPTNFNGVNFIQKLEGFYNNKQLGDTCSLNDDIFGLLALIASGNLANTQVKQDSLNYIIAKQDPTGGFGFTTPGGCDQWYSPSADMTAAGVYALQEAKNNGLSSLGLDDAIEKAKQYLINNQNDTGGFGYFGSTDSDTTGWVLIALNALGMKDSEQAIKAKTWLLTQQSESDGGFTAFDWGSNTFVSNATTSAHSLIALLGKSWIIKIYNPNQASQTPSNITPTPSPSVNNPLNNSLTPTVTPLPTSPVVSPTILPFSFADTSSLEVGDGTEEISPTPIIKDVLGSFQNNDNNHSTKLKAESDNRKMVAETLIILGFISLTVFGFQNFVKKRRIASGK